MRHAFGFSDEDIFENDTPDVPAIEAHIPAADAAADPQPADMADIREAVFTHVLTVFNEALPDFLARSVDPEAQRRLLLERMDAGLKEYLAKVAADADSRCEARWSNEQATLRTEMETLRHKAEQIEHDRADLKQKQLSADRQKRALSERMHDLESQISRLESEREQFELENKSLVNKLKIVALRYPDALEADMPDPLPSPEEFKSLQQENAQLNEAIRQAADRQAIADEMAADLRKRLADATEEYAQLKESIEERDATLERQRDNIRRLKEQIAMMSDSARAAEARFAAREAELKAMLDEARSKAARAVEEPTMASEDIIRFCDSGAAADEAQAEPTTEAPAQEPAAKTRKPRKRKEKSADTTTTAAPKITDDDLNDVEAAFSGYDWFGVPDPQEPKAPQQPDPQDDFGYHAPEPRPRPYDDGMQMSLFD